MAARNLLVAGASGLVGMAAVRHFAQQADCELTAVSLRPPKRLDGANLLSEAVNEKPGELVQGRSDRQHMQINLRMLENLFEPLAAAATNLEHVTLLQGTK